MSFKPHGPAVPLLIGYDPYVVLGSDHLCRFIDRVVDLVVGVERSEAGKGQPGYCKALLIKILLYSYCTGVFSSRRIAQNCMESLPLLFLNRGEHPSHARICQARIAFEEDLDLVWLELMQQAQMNGVKFLGKVVVDSTKIRADVSEDSVILEKDYPILLERLKALLVRAAEADLREDEEGEAVRTGTEVDVERLDMRRIVRTMKGGVPEGEITSRMLGRIDAGIQTLEAAEKENLKHASLTDPDARMAPIGASRRIAMSHTLETAVESGIIVAANSDNLNTDNARLPALLKQVERQSPGGVTEVLADSGFFQGAIIESLLSQGLNVIVPDSVTTGQMRRPETRIEFTRKEEEDVYLCPEGRTLSYKCMEKGARVYKTSESCRDCPLCDNCLRDKKSVHRTLKVSEESKRMSEYLAKFFTPEIRKEYYARGPGVETVYAYIKHVLKFLRWSVRGSEKIAAEASLLTAAYQTRKLHTTMAKMKLA